MRKDRKFRYSLLAIALGIAPGTPQSHAARPMVTDDARTVDAGACQVEAWQRTLRGSRERWAFPACNPTGSLEVTFGGNDIPDGNGGRANDFVLQGKTLFRNLETNSYGYGLAVGTFVHGTPDPGQGTLKSVYFYLPISMSFGDDRLFVHTNIGAQNDHDTQTKSLTWGIGTEVVVTPRVTLVAESYGDNHTRPFFHGGIRFWIVPNRLQVDTTIGAQSGDLGASRWFSIGLRAISPPFLR